MGDVNFDAIKGHVSTQYGDLTGVIQIDGHDNISSIYDLCNDYGFNTDEKFIIGFGLGESTIQGVGEDDEVYCSVLYVDENVYGDNFEAIEAKIKMDRKLILKKKDILVKYSSLGKYIKRYEFVVTSELTRSVQTIEIEED